MARTYYAIDNEPYGRAQGHDGRRIGRIYAFGTHALRAEWCAESLTDFQTERGYREPIAARSRAVMATLRSYDGCAVPEEECPVCGRIEVWAPGVRARMAAHTNRHRDDYAAARVAS